jgi:hypothetical protein
MFTLEPHKSIDQTIKKSRFVATAVPIASMMQRTSSPRIPIYVPSSSAGSGAHHFDTFTCPSMKAALK